jgi:hypothetical protein
MTRVEQQNGYILLPVVLLISLVATLAFMLNHESAQDTGIVGSLAELKQSEYVAQAGLQHSLQQIVTAGCGSYTDFTDKPFGIHKYSTTITPNNAGGILTMIPVPVSNDAWIKSDTPTQNYGNDTQLNTYFKFSPSETQRTLYRFDIENSGISTGALVVSAVARIFVLDSNASASVNIHRINADWTEASVNWDNINISHDFSSVASIPSGSPAGQYVDVNITPLAQGWINGSIANQGIMLKTTFIDDLAQYTSKEYGNTSQRPELIIKVSDGSLSNRADVTATGTLASGIAQTLNRSNIKLYQNPPSNLGLQPDATEGKDAEIWDQAPNNNYGNAAETWVSSASNDTTRSLLRFNMGAIPYGAKILEATLSLRHRSGSGADQPVSAHRIRNPWSEDSVTWNHREPGTTWDTAGSDFDNMAVTTTPVGPVNQRYKWNITPLVQGWVDGSYPNYGVVLVAAIAGMPGERFDTSDHTDPSLWPSLSITYACECGVACQIPQGSGKVLLVIGDDITLAAADSQKKALFESWGYSINLIDDDADQSTFNDALDNNDVTYISETVWGPTLANKLVATDKGVVNEEEYQNNRLGLSSSGSYIVNDSMEIIDNSHYVTALFPNGVVPIFSAPMQGMLVTGTPAPGLQTLGNFSGTASLALVDGGGTLQGGGTAPGRRVAIPIGSNDKFNWDYLNNNGRLIVQRAIQWGMGVDVASPPGPIAHWKLDDAAGTTSLDSEGGHDGTLSGGNWTTGKDNGALDFDGSNDYVDLTSDAELDDVFLGGATVMAWIRVTDWGESDHGRILDKSSQTAGDRDGWMIAVNGDNPSVEIAQGFTGGRGYWRTQAGTFTLNDWVHVAFVYDASSAANDPVIYLNGVAQSSLVEVSPSGTLRSDASISLRMGNHAQSTSRTFDGKIDDVRIYDRMLDAAEINDIASGGGGEGGDGGCNGTFRDEFNDIRYDQNDGTLNWVTDWEETGESLDPDGGDIRIDDDEDTYELKVRDDGQTIMREADLSQAGAATLSFDYWRVELNGSSDYVAVEVSYNGGSSWNELDRFTGTADDSAYTSTSYTLDASSLSANTRIRFLTPSSGMNNDNQVLFDNIQILCSP